MGPSFARRPGHLQVQVLGGCRVSGPRPHPVASGRPGGRRPHFRYATCRTDSPDPAPATWRGRPARL